MKLKLNLVFFIVLCFFSAQKTFSQCFQIESILVDACDNGLQPGNDEGFNEMVRFRVGTSNINANDLSVTWPSNSWQGIIQNATTKSKVTALNIQIAAAGGCGKLIEPVGGLLPANAKVILVTSYNFSIASNVFGAITENIYIIFQDNATTSGGHFGNYGAAATRTLSMSFLGCSDTVSYDRSLLVNINGTYGGTSAEKNGASVNYTPSGSATYTNNGCSAPVEVFMLDAGASQSACQGATIPLSGTAQGQKSVLWSASSGSFSDATSLTSTYTFDPAASGSVELTLTAINSCDVPKAVKVNMTVKSNVIPNFPTASTICSGDPASTLNTTSPNGITGTWLPPMINNTTGGSYVFTPTAGQCATPITYIVTVNNCGFNTYSSAAWLANCTTPSGQFYNITGSGADLINPGSPVGSFMTDMGSFIQNSGSLTFGGGEIKTSKTASANVCGGTMYYNIHPQGAAAGTFTPLVLNFFSDCNSGSFTGGGPCSPRDQKWQTVTTGLVDMTALPLGNYVLEVYYSVTGNNNATSLCPDTLLLNNGGVNYLSTFSIQDAPKYNSTNPTICSGSDGTITISGLLATTGYTLSYKDGAVAVPSTSKTSDASGKIVISGLNAGSYSNFVLAATCGTYTNNTPIVLVDPVLPALTALTAVSPVCSGGNAVFNLEGTANATISYTIGISIPQIVVLDSSGKASITVNAITSDTTIVLSQIDLGSCNATINNTATVAITTTQNAGTLSGVQALCSNGTTVFSSTQLGGTWSSSDTAIATVDATGTVTGIAAGIATITYTMNGIGSCSTATAIRTVTITSAANAGILSGVQTICSIGSTTFTTNGDLGGTWSSSDISIATVDAAGIITPMALGTAIITYTVAGSGICPNATATRTVTVAVAPNAGTLSGIQVICSNGTTTFTSTQSGGTWSSSDTAIATVDVAGIVTPIAGGTATINYMLIGTGGCPDATATRTVTITAAPNAGTISGVQTICSNGTTTFTSNGDLGGEWSSSDALIAMVSATGIITPIAAGSATITYKVMGSGGCSDATATRIVTITAAPKAGTISGIQSICSNGTTTFSSTQAGGTWSSSDSAIATVDVAGLVTPIAAGSATITYKVMGSGGCSDASATRTVTITAAPKAGTLSGIQTICSNGTTTFTSNGDLGGSWSSSDALMATVGATGIVTPLAAGNVTITYKVTGIGGCTDATATRTVTITVAPNAGTLSGIPVICSNGTTVFSSNGDVAGTWTSSDAAIAIVNATGTITGMAAGSATITYTVTGAGGCIDAKATRSVTVNNPTLTITASCVETDYTLVATTSDSSPTYAWYKGVTLLAETSNTLVVKTTDNYRVVMNSGGCPADASENVTFFYCEIPKGISPNGDGKNDVFDLSNFHVKKLEIFNRYGIKVYSKSNYNKEWNGTTDSGQELPDATYYYVVEFENGTTKTGWVYINK